MFPRQYFYRDTISRKIANQGLRGSLFPWDETIPRSTSTHYFLVSGKLLLFTLLLLLLLLLSCRFVAFAKAVLNAEIFLLGELQLVAKDQEDAFTLHV